MSFGSCFYCWIPLGDTLHIKSALCLKARESLEGLKVEEMKESLTCLESRSIAENIRFLCVEFSKKFLHYKPSDLLELILFLPSL